MMRSERIPGLSVAVVDADGVRCAAGFGTADLATGLPATTTTAYLWFSMTKIVTATAAMRLADEGRLDLDAPVTDVAPELRAPRDGQPTVRQLLQHTAGLANPVPIRWVHPADADPPDPQALLHRLLRRRRAYRYPVGGAARYSNVGYLAAGRVVEVAAGMPFERYVREAVLDPLGMTRTGFGHAADIEVAAGYVRAPRALDPLLRAALPRGVVGRRRGAHLGLDRFLVDGPAFGGLVGDVLDAARFLRMHLRDAIRHHALEGQGVFVF